MNIFKRIGAVLGGSKPIDEMAQAYPQSALDPAQDLANYPAKVFLGEKNIFAYRLEFMVSEPDAARVVQTVGSEFDLPSHATFQEGPAKKGSLSLHFSSRPEFGGAVVVIVTNSIPLLKKIDALDLAPPPPWVVFPEADPLALGSLQGAMEHWFDWLFLPFWNSADPATRSRYVAKHGASKEWREFLVLHAP
ncbi:hypothetical protein SAMN05428959_103619 [Duganella sp. CF517]|uniref:hypothetical protein n=1 Tax=Duganella sp. CF517 TaxID=1881038 RepID=UPI0008AB2827|nr:hypothetical protein [Duganella sp. CF517]SEN88938.1 hypothetical protein SAMN05428959_103619 [Duganella sp. CF517]